jgi:hypothetical protein
MSTTPVDWFRIIIDLERAGFSHGRIADECLMGKTWVWSLKNVPDHEPRHWDGQVLLSVWSTAMDMPASDAPRMRQTVGNANR